MVEKILPYPCLCGGKMKEINDYVEFFGREFPAKVEICTSCGERYVSGEEMKKLEKEFKKLGLFGLERKIIVSKSKDSLVIKIPPEIRKMLGIKHKSVLSLVPIDKRTFEVHVIS